MERFSPRAQGSCSFPVPSAIRRLSLCALAPLWFAVAGAAPPAANKPPASLTMQGNPPFHYDFRLEKGAGTPVCDAYVQRLRNTDFHRLPQCGRPENTSVAGFGEIRRVPLTDAETRALYDPVKGLLFYDDPDHFEKARTESARRGSKPGVSDAEIAAGLQANLSRRGYQTFVSRPPVYFRLEQVDIDNDGTPDSVVVWQQEIGPACGERWDHGLFGYEDATYLALFNTRNELDIERTRKLRMLGATLGVFSFQGTYYIDTFRSPVGDLEAQFQAGKSVSDVLLVYQQKNGVNTLACEIASYDRPRN